MLKLKENKTVGKTFPDCWCYSGITDAFNNPCYLVVNDLMKEFRVVGKNPDYAKQRKTLPKYVHVRKYLNVIDLKRSVAEELEERFPYHDHGYWQIWND